MRTRRQVTALLVAMAVTMLGIAGLLAWRAGLSAYVVRTGSMTPTLRPGDVVVDAPPTTPRPGQVVTFRLVGGQVITHRVAASGPDGIHTKGDANRTTDPWRLRTADLLGHVSAVVPRAGYALVYLRQPAGAASLVTCVWALLLAWRLFFGGPEPRRATTAAGALAAVLLVAAAMTSASRSVTPTGATFSDSRTGILGVADGHHGPDGGGDAADGNRPAQQADGASASAARG